MIHLRARRLVALLVALCLSPALALSQEVDDGFQRGAAPFAPYVGVAQQNVTVRAEMSTDAPSVGFCSKGSTVYILSYEPYWLKVVVGEDDHWKTGYVLRHTVSETSSRTGDILPYGTTPAAYTAVLKQDAPLRKSTAPEGETILTLKKGAKVAILSIEDGWAKVIYWRQFAYFYLDAVESLTPVYDLETAQAGDTIAAFISFYRTDSEGLNPNRMINIKKACDYISIALHTDEAFSFNGIAGPYQTTRGYLQGMSYFEGRAVPSTGGGVCQVSSTLYNVLLALPGGLDITYRRAHGPSGAVYLPHGVDAAVGSPTLDLVFRNQFDFPVRIDAYAQDGVLFISMLKDSNG